jgi:replication-associated recombination protein RarA
MLDVSRYDPLSPTRVEDIVGNTGTWSRLAAQIRENSIPHVVLCGPAGCGKSLFLKIVLEIEKSHPVLRIDCTANSGLRDLRDSVRGFARGSRTNAGDFRWIVLEHADALTADTQAFLRRMMETTSNTTRIVFECRDAGAIAEPILSRSSLYTVNGPDDTEVFFELMRRTEFQLNPEVVRDIIRLCGSNMRKCLLKNLALRWNGEYVDHFENDEYDRLLKQRPASSADSKEWIRWAIEAEQTCRLQGLDMRDLLNLGWKNNQHVSYMCGQWSRLGGMSPRALFFNCMKYLKDSPY